MNISKISIHPRLSVITTLKLSECRLENVTGNEVYVPDCGELAISVHCPNIGLKTCKE